MNVFGILRWWRSSQLFDNVLSIRQTEFIRQIHGKSQKCKCISGWHRTLVYRNILDTVEPSEKGNYITLSIRFGYKSESFTLIWPGTMSNNLNSHIRQFPFFDDHWICSFSVYRPRIFMGLPPHHTAHLAAQNIFASRHNDCFSVKITKGRYNTFGPTFYVCRNKYSQAPPTMKRTKMCESK